MADLSKLTVLLIGDYDLPVKRVLRPNNNYFYPAKSYRFIAGSYGNFKFQALRTKPASYEIKPGKRFYVYEFKNPANGPVTGMDPNISVDYYTKDAIIKYKGELYSVRLDPYHDRTDLYTLEDGKRLFLGTIVRREVKYQDTKILIEEEHDEWQTINYDIYDIFDKENISWRDSEYLDSVIYGKGRLKCSKSTEFSGPGGYVSIYGEKYLNKWFKEDTTLRELYEIDKMEFISYILTRSCVTGSKQQYLGSGAGIQEYLTTIYDDYYKIYKKLLMHIGKPKIDIRNVKDDVFISYEIPLCGFSYDKQAAIKHVGENKDLFIRHAISMIKLNSTFKRLNIPINMFKMYEMVITNASELVIRFCLKDKLVQLLSQES